VIVPDHIKDWTIVLQLGAEGGSLTLYGMQTERGWFFCRNLIDWTPQLIDEERIQHKSPVVDSWGAALTLRAACRRKRAPAHELIRHRRVTVESLSRGYQPGETERQIDLFLKFQDAIAALDAVIDAEAPK